ncbi:MAG: hypothetical protein H6649_06050 [Caldilineae bacterium]|nr:hypothetical protein [Caldilineae bacterium]
MTREHDTASQSTSSQSTNLPISQSTNVLIATARRMLFRLSPTGFEALLSGGEAKGRGMALEASADLSIFPGLRRGTSTSSTGDVIWPPAPATVETVAWYGEAC